MWPQTQLGLIKQMRSSQASVRCNPLLEPTNKTFVASRNQVYIEDPVRNLDVHVILMRKTEKICIYTHQGSHGVAVRTRRQTLWVRQLDHWMLRNQLLWLFGLGLGLGFRFSAGGG